MAQRADESAIPRGDGNDFLSRIENLQRLCADFCTSTRWIVWAAAFPGKLRMQLLSLPVYRSAIILAYGLARISALGFGEARDAIFAKVSARAIRQVALTTFEHLHQLSLRFHLDRKTGGMMRSLERGTAGIEFLLSFMLFNILPTLLEIVLVCGILWALFNIWFALATFVTIIGYIAFTLMITEWRTKYRREMNATNSEANSKSVDSLLNYETVKYFGNEAHEARRYEVALANYERAFGA